MALAVLQAARPISKATPFTHPALDAALRAEAAAGDGNRPDVPAHPRGRCGAKRAALVRTLEVLGAPLLNESIGPFLKLNSAHGERM